MTPWVARWPHHVTGVRGGLVARVVAGYVRKHPWRSISGCAVALLLAVSAAFGGMQRAASADPAVPVVAKGEVVHAGPWDVVVDRVVYTDEFPTINHTVDGDRWVVAVATITNTSGITQPAEEARLDQALTFGPFAGRRDEPVELRLVSDGAIRFELMPGVPTDVAFFVAHDGALDPPATAEVQVTGWKRARRFSTGVLAWIDPAPVAPLTSPVTEGRE